MSCAIIDSFPRSRNRGHAYFGVRGRFRLGERVLQVAASPSWLCRGRSINLTDSHRIGCFDGLADAESIVVVLRAE